MPSNYPPGTWVGDPRAPWNQDTEASEAAYEMLERRVEDLSGRELYESTVIDPDSMLDTFPITAHVFKTFDTDPWPELGEEVQKWWDDLAELVVRLGLMQLSEDLVDEALSDGRL